MKRKAQRLAVSFLLFVVAVGEVQAQDDEWLNRKVQITETQGTCYQLLRHVSEQTGYLFVYDSRTLNNDAQVQMGKGEYTLRDAITAITGNRGLRISLIGNNHIALRLPEQQSVFHPAPEEVLPGKKHFTVSGTVYDLFSKETISSATVGVVGASVGTVTNRDGRFRISLPDSMIHVTLRISHVGYESLDLKAALWVGSQSGFMLEPKVVSLQEVVVRVVNPRNLLQQMLDARPQNYSSLPASLTAFYREVVEHKKRNVDLTEAVLKIYKTGYNQSFTADQVKLVKMRRILDKQERDTIITKVKSGIQSTLLLDVIKNEPDFLDPHAAGNVFDYTHTDIAVVDNRLANVISFEQSKGVREPFYRGELFIDTDNNALLEARFQVNPAYIEKATSLFVEKRSKNHKLTLRDARYAVSYKPLPNGKYYMNHAKGELEFRVRRKHQWFSSSLKIRFEFVTCKVDTDRVQSIPRSERLSQRTIFSDTKYPYDAGFWENFNVILPEDELKDLILNNLTEVAGGNGEDAVERNTENTIAN